MLSTAEKRRRVEGFRQRCRELDLVVTFHRQKVYESLLDRVDHPSADAVYERIREEVPQISRASVFRILDRLAEVGLIQRIMTPGSAARYDGNADPHCHLICRICGAIDDWDTDCIEQLDIPDNVPGHFQIEEVTVNFSGICSHCQKQNGR